MKLFGYYAWHSLKNQIKKLFKTWVLIVFLACFVIGGIIGVGAAMLEEAAGPEDPGYVEELPEEDEYPEEEIPEEELWAVVELGAGGIILAMFFFLVIGADKNGSRIFQPADVNLLFPSPMKPQSVLLFRVVTQLGAILLSSLYFAFQLPNMVMNMGLGAWAAVGLVVAWLLTVAIAQLLQILLYTLASTHPVLKKHMRTGIYALVALIAGGFILFTRSSGLDYYAAAKAFFNHPATRFIPLWGWLKALCMCALEGNWIGALVSCLAVLLGGACLAAIIWRLPADFYEDAMAKSQETAELLEVAQAEKSTGFVKRKKDRSEKLKRDGLEKGWGASVFFHKSLYNRFRFAHLGIFTKTAETYLVAAAAVGSLCRFAIETDGTVPVVLTLGVFAFFRTLGNPLTEDTGKDFFRMIPEPTGKKLFYSILGGTVNCLLDLLPAMVVTLLLCGSGPLELLAWCLVIVSVDFYGTNVATFIDLSTPVAAGKTIKQVVQILFIYFGLLPDIAIMAVGIVFDQVALGALGAAAANFAIGGIFLALSPLFLDPKEMPRRSLRQLTPEENKTARKTFSRLGLGCLTILLSGSVLQLLCAQLMEPWLDQSWAVWVYSFAPLYLVAVPLGLLVIKKLPKLAPEKQSLAPRQMVKLAFISIFMMYGGNYLATLLLTLLSSLVGDINTTPGVVELATDGNWAIQILVMVVLAPCIEEFIFRKTLIDRMRPYGGKLAVLVSALMFGLFHGNFAQFVYATALGLVLGYVYEWTGKLRYSIGIHMGINFLGSVVSGWLLENLDLEALADESQMFAAMQTPAFAAYLCFLVFILVSMVLGLVLLCRNARKVRFGQAPMELGKGKWRIAWGNAGMILFTLVCCGSIVISFLIM